MYRSLLLLGLSAQLPAQSPPRAVERRVEVNGDSRTVMVYAPPSARAAARGLIILLHGHGGSGADLLGQGRSRAAPYRAWFEVAAPEGLVLLAPDGTVGPDGQRGWNDCRADASTNPGADDVGFIARLISDVRTEFRVPADRVFLAGTSNGGHMALRIAIEQPALVRAVASIVGGMPSQSRCAVPSNPVSVLFMNGTADPLMPYGGGRIGRGRDARGSVLSVDSSVAIWRRLAGLTTATDSTAVGQPLARDPTSVVRTTWSRPGGPAIVMRYRVNGGGHTEPSRSERYAWLFTRLVGPQSSAIESVDEIWRFFQLASAPPGR